MTAEATPAPSASSGSLDQAFRHGVAVLEGLRPDAAREPRLVAALHDLEEPGRLVLLVVELARVGLHRAAAGIRLEAPDAAARARRAAPPDDHVADLAGRSPTLPALALEDQPATHARAPEDAEQVLVRRACTELELGQGRDVDVVADRDRSAERGGERRGQREDDVPAGDVAGVGDRPGLRVDHARGADPDAAEGRRLDAGARGRLAQRRCHLCGDRGRPVGRCGVTRLPEHLVIGSDDHGLDLRPAEIDSAVQGRLLHVGERYRWCHYAPRVPDRDPRTRTCARASGAPRARSTSCCSRSRRASAPSASAATSAPCSCATAASSRPATTARRAGFPRCNADERGCHRCAEPARYPAGTGYDVCICVHAEQNALLQAARLGYTSDGADCYTTLRPCFGCLKELHQGGVASVRYLNAWAPSPAPLRAAYDGLLAQLGERGVRVEQLALAPELLDLRGAG